ncbi:MAG: hypothetical protein V1652_04005 [bacterium]
MSKKILIIISILFFTIFLMYSKPLFQEGNPLPVLYGIAKLTFTHENIVQIPGDNNKYITKNKDGRDYIISLMQEKGYTLSDQMGSGYRFENKDKSAFLIEHRYYSRLYDIWYFSTP